MRKNPEINSFVNTKVRKQVGAPGTRAEAPQETVEEPCCRSRAILKDCSPQERPVQEKFMKNCGSWRGLRLEEGKV